MREIIKKTKSDSFEAIVSGKKKFEIRIEDDCEYNEGDTLILKEVNSEGEFTGREVKKRITWVSRTDKIDYWSKEQVDRFGFAVLSLE